VAPFMGWWLPEGVSTHAHSVDWLFYFILAITGFFFVLTEALLCVFMFKYAADREKPDTVSSSPSFAAKLFKPVTNLLSDQHKVEMAWTIVPAILLLYIAFAQVNTWADIKYQSRMPTVQGKTTPLQAAISARQFEWRVRYPSVERFEKWMSDQDNAEVAKDFITFANFEQKDDIHVVNELHVIKQNPVVVHLSTRDVIHSFNLPNMRVKQDALPGKKIPVWFTPTKSNTELNKEGQYVDGINVDGIGPEKGKKDEHFIWELPCAELCGWGHYRMVGKLYVHKNQEEFLDWLKKTESQNNAHQTEKIATR